VIDSPAPAGEGTAGRGDAAATKLLSGVDALVELLLLREQLDERDGLSTATMVSGYPGSPLGTFDLALEGSGALSGRILHRPGLNEELAAATVWGSQMGGVAGYAGVDGVAGVWYGKTPGLDRSGDALKHANAMGAGPNGGVVLFCGDDPTAKSSTLASDSQYTFLDACIPVLYPGDQQEILDLGIHAFRMSRFAGCWVGLKVVTAVADGIATVATGLERHDPAEPVDLTIHGKPWRHRILTTVGAHAVADQEMLVVHDRLIAARAYARHNRIDRCTGAAPGTRLGIVCAGKTYFDLLQAFGDLGLGPEDLPDLGVRILKLGMTYPLEEETVVDFAGSAEELLVIEEKRPFVETQLRAVLHEAGSSVPVSGKRDRCGRALVPEAGELDAASVVSVLRRTVPGLERREPGPSPRAGIPLGPVAARPPGFCSGCPHNRSTVFPEGALVGGGVGCHGIMYFEARNAGMKSMPPTPMGAEGVPWIGLAPFVDERHLIQNLGDGTLSHSGTLAIRASVAAGVNITFKILYNSAVAMTGGQDVTGLIDVPAVTRALEAEGVRRTVVCAEDPKHYGPAARWAKGVVVVGREELPARQEELRSVPGVTVIVYDQRCAAEARRLRRRGLLEEPAQRVVINEAVCEGCGDCSAKSNCLSVLPLPTEFGVKRQIHDPSCNRDFTCLEGDCPSFVTITARRRWRTSGPPPRQEVHGRHRLPGGVLPAPRLPAVERQYGIYLTGIGGTGVVTANRILASAAAAAGLVVGGMDQTGLSQKAGAVVSHLHLVRQGVGHGAATVSSGGANLYLSSDILQAAGEKHLEKVWPGRSIAVVDPDLTPTTPMLQGSLAPPDVLVLKQAIVERVGRDRVAFVEAHRMSELLLGNHLLANVILLGAGFQLGAIPVSLDHFEAAIRGEREGGDGDSWEAFQWGRWAIHDPARVSERLDAADDGEAEQRSIFEPSPEASARASACLQGRSIPAELRDLLARRTAQVIDYQDAALAEQYLDLVEEAASSDDAAHGWALTEAVAESWFKLLTYKDEYEVARLHLKADYGRAAALLGIDGPFKVKYHLHPPVLRRLGLERKIPLGKPYEVAFHALRAMRRLRGTRLDPFGWEADRRTERAIIAEYARMVRDLLRREGSSYEARVAVARSALEIKGYGPIKETAVARWRRETSAAAVSAQ
jgi:indolepyruvate ferredoxin oxidoreductase